MDNMLQLTSVPGKYGTNSKWTSAPGKRWYIRLVYLENVVQ